MQWTATAHAEGLVDESLQLTHRSGPKVLDRHLVSPDRGRFVWRHNYRYVGYSVPPSSGAGARRDPCYHPVPDWSQEGVALRSRQIEVGPSLALFCSCSVSWLYIDNLLVALVTCLLSYDGKEASSVRVLVSTTSP